MAGVHAALAPAAARSRPRARRRRSTPYRQCLDHSATTLVPAVVRRVERDGLDERPDVPHLPLVERERCAVRAARPASDGDARERPRVPRARRGEARRIGCAAARSRPISSARARRACRRVPTARRARASIEQVARAQAGISLGDAGSRGACASVRRRWPSALGEPSPAGDAEDAHEERCFGGEAANAQLEAVAEAFLRRPKPWSLLAT